MFFALCEKHRLCWLACTIKKAERQPMLQYPKMIDLPEFIKVTSPVLDSFVDSVHPSKNFHRIYFREYTLILKLEGSFYSYRDWVASRLFQHIQVNAQSSILLRIPKSLLSEQGLSVNDMYQQGIVVIERHDLGPCGPSCDYNKLKEDFHNHDYDFASTIFRETEVFVQRSLLAHFFAANEPSDFLVGKDHRIYLIDNSQMFSYFPTHESIIEWLDIFPMRDKKAQKRILQETARRISSLEPHWKSLCKIPPEYKADRTWDIKVNIAETIRIAKKLSDD